MGACGWVCACWVQVPIEARRGCQSWSCKWLWATWCGGVGTELRLSARPLCTPKHWAITTAPTPCKRPQSQELLRTNIWLAYLSFHILTKFMWLCYAVSMELPSPWKWGDPYLKEHKFLFGQCGIDPFLCKLLVSSHYSWCLCFLALFLSNVVAIGLCVFWSVMVTPIPFWKWVM